MKKEIGELKVPTLFSGPIAYQDLAEHIISESPGFLIGRGRI
jgi:hypothetical protein